MSTFIPRCAAHFEAFRGDGSWQRRGWRLQMTMRTQAMMTGAGESDGQRRGAGEVIVGAGPSGA